jgi:hypothetical protein
LVGKRHTETADMSLPEVAERIHANILTVQSDQMIAPEANFVVAADTTGPVGLIHITVSGLDTPPGTSPHFHDRAQLTHSTINTVFALTGDYNRVERAHPHRARFLVAIDAVGTDGQRYSGYLATMQWTTGNDR